MIDLTAIGQQVTEPAFVDNGFDANPFLGGVSQRYDFPGSRHATTITMPPMAIEANGRRWVVRLIRAKQEDGKVTYSQPGFNVGAPGSPTVATLTEGGRFLPITGATPNYAIREGQALTITTGDRGYFYLSSAQTILDSSGAGIIELDVPLRIAAAAGDGVNLSRPTIEGAITGDGFGWTYEKARTVGLSFTIKERK